MVFVQFLTLVLLHLVTFRTQSLFKALYFGVEHPVDFFPTGFDVPEFYLHTVKNHCDKPGRQGFAHARGS